jgi:hypothetical protein
MGLIDIDLLYSCRSVVPVIVHVHESHSSR